LSAQEPQAKKKTPAVGGTISLEMPWLASIKLTVAERVANREILNFVNSKRIFAHRFIRLINHPSFPPLPTGGQALHKEGIPLFDKEALGEIFRKIYFYNWSLFINCFDVIPVKTGIQ